MNTQTATIVTKKETKIFVDNKEIDFLQFNDKGRITANGDVEDTTKAWDSVFIDPSSVNVGECPKICFNKRENKKIGKDPVWTQLNYPITKIEEIEIKIEKN